MFRALGTDLTTIDRWATGPNDYWPRIQQGLTNLPAEVNKLSLQIKDQYQRVDEIIADHLDALIELLQGYKVISVNILASAVLFFALLLRIYANDLMKLYKSNIRQHKK